MRITRCDGPECLAEFSGRSIDFWNYEWLTVEANEDADHGQFCSWSCLAAWATSRAMEREALR